LQVGDEPETKEVMALMALMELMGLMERRHDLI